MTGQREATWRETVPGEYWKCGPWRIEFIGRTYCVYLFEADGMKLVSSHSTWVEAAKAVEKEMDK